MVCRILVADDSSTIQKVIRIGLSSVPNDIRSVSSMTEAMRAVETAPVDLIIAGAGLPGVSTANDFIKLLEHAGRVPIIILIGSYDVVREADLRSAGIQHIMKKPFPPGDLTRIVAELAPNLKMETPNLESPVKAPTTGRNSE
jgi:DNA-binding response OmpR family regulator